MTHKNALTVCGLSDNLITLNVFPRKNLFLPYHISCPCMRHIQNNMHAHMSYAQFNYGDLTYADLRQAESSYAESLDVLSYATLEYTELNHVEQISLWVYLTQVKLRSAYLSFVLCLIKFLYLQTFQLHLHFIKVYHYVGTR